MKIIDIKHSNKIKKKKSVKKTIVTSIHYNKKWLKLKHCFSFLKELGFNSINDTRKIKINWNNVHTYCKENEENIQCLFDCKKMIWKTEIDSDEKKSLNLYINKKLESMIGINFEANRRCIYYKLNQLFIL